MFATLTPRVSFLPLTYAYFFYRELGTRGDRVGGQPFANGHPVVKVDFSNFHNASPQNDRYKR